MTEGGLASAIVNELKRVARATPFKTPPPEPVDLNVWMPIGLAETWLGVTIETVESYIKRELLKSFTTERGAMFVDRRQVEELREKSITRVVNVVEGSSSRIEIPERPFMPTGPIIVVSSEQKSGEQATEWLPIRTPWNPGP